MAQQKGFVITGTVTGLAEKSRVTLVDLNKPTDTLARALVTKGTFVLEGISGGTQPAPAELRCGRQKIGIVHG